MGPVIGGFAAQGETWKWPIYELMWISAFSLIFLSILLPETYGPNILLKRARRLRKLTGNEKLRSQSEIDEAALGAREVLFESLVRPFVLAMEPAVLFCNVYLGLVCEFPLHSMPSYRCLCLFLFRLRLLPLVRGLPSSLQRDLPHEPRRRQSTLRSIRRLRCHHSESPPLLSLNALFLIHHLFSIPSTVYTFATIWSLVSSEKERWRLRHVWRSASWLVSSSRSRYSCLVGRPGLLFIGESHNACAAC